MTMKALRTQTKCTAFQSKATGSGRRRPTPAIATSWLSNSSRRCNGSSSLRLTKKSNR